tara:strand:+ start:433 stop:624 length:192 start_codon:yes stop_codon:yes gene_type:complete
MSDKKEDRTYFKKIDLSSFKKYGKQEVELNKLLKAVKNAENYDEEVKAKISLRKYLKKAKESE